MKFIIAAAVLIGVFGVALLTAPAQALSPVPAQCVGMTFDNVIDQPASYGVFRGTAGRDLIIIKGGIVYGEGGNDCVQVADASIVFGGAGDDVLIYKGSRSKGQVLGDYQTSPFIIYTYDPAGCDPEEDFSCTEYQEVFPEGIDRCIGKWDIRKGCEFAN